VRLLGNFRTPLLVVAVLAIVACAGTEQSPDDEARVAFDDVRAAITDVVADQERAAQATALVDEMEQVVKDAAASHDARRDAFRRLSANYDTPRAELEASLEQVREGMRDNYRKYIDTRRRIAALLTDEEWETLQKQRSEALSKALAAVRS